MIRVPKILKKIKDPVSCLTHMAGAIASIVGMIFLILLAVREGTPWHIVGFSILELA